MSSQIMNNNTYTMAPTSPNPYVSRKLNNIDQARIMKREREDWLRLSQDTEGIGNNGRHTKIGEKYQETGRRS